MDRQKTDDEARSTKKTGNVLYWILGIGIVLMILAVIYGLSRHDGDVAPQTDGTSSGQVLSDSIAGDGMSDSVATDIQR